MASSSYRAEAERWLTIAEKLLRARDLHGAKTFAIRARESDPRVCEFADHVIAVADTLLAGDLRVGDPPNASHDYYAILQLGRLTQSMELVATQYRKLALLLNPSRNRLIFSDHAFKLVSDAWLVFSNPSKKAMYDHELQLSQLGQFGLKLPHPPQPPLHPQPIQPQVSPSSRSPKTNREDQVTPQPSIPVPLTYSKSPESTRPVSQPKHPSEPTRPLPSQPPATTTTTTTQATATPAAESTRSATRSSETEFRGPSFWTACPYCYILYEYPKVYEECALKCQNCKRAFHAAMIPSPPVTGKDEYFCCWGFFPLGAAGNVAKFTGGWSPISAMFATPLQGGGKVAAAENSGNRESKVTYKDDLFIDISESSEDESNSDDDDDDDDEEWEITTNRKKRAKKGKGTPNKNAKKFQSERGRKLNEQNMGGVGRGGGGGGGNVEEDVVVVGGGKAGEESSSGGGGGGGSGKKKKATKDLGKLDLNVMFSNELEDAVPAVSEGNRAGNEEEDNISGIAFFEGLDEFLSSLPILSVVGDDKVKAT